ncbi:ABC transporter substrate-binding protein [Methanospirillum stamsii]|uniref:Iron ABC transporter substrate-binding protein n=1 Tax=Methanospirillum stamsii TaxID=1277351 RepID=A0A2V2N7P7_9EURY|nr:ABC transporter substrate-binding protein [Methanospirillum stamsii]PWR74555.1 iron ABC transporter substrate-binding protein [Methanospirillum stamsii]
MKEKLSMCAILICFIFMTSVLADNSGTQIHFTDANGREITLEKNPERIAFSSYMIAEAIKLIGAWDKVAGRDGYISDPKLYPNLDTIPAISDSDGHSHMDFEKIVEIKPDVLIMPAKNDNTNQDDDQLVINSLEPDIPVVYIDVTNPDTFNENLKNLGKITGKEENAERYLDFYNGIMNQITEKSSSIPDTEKPNVFVKAAGYTPDQLCTKGNKEVIWNQICDISGGKSISSDLNQGWTDVDPEWLVNKDIDAIVAECWDQLYPGTFGYTATEPSQKKTSADKIIADIANLEELSQSDAVKNNRIYLMHDPLMNTPRFIIGTAYLAKWFHPELFQDLNPEKIHEQYLDFLDADYDLDVVGYAGYP